MTMGVKSSKVTSNDCGFSTLNSRVMQNGCTRFHERGEQSTAGGFSRASKLWSSVRLRNKPVGMRGAMASDAAAKRHSAAVTLPSRLRMPSYRRNKLTLAVEIKHTARNPRDPVRDKHTAAYPETTGAPCVVRETFDPRVLLKYDVKAVIGKGSFSRVVRVEHKVTKQRYAVKVLEAKEGTGPFESELRILCRVKHPNVIQLVEIFRSKRKVYMVMHLATGGELYDRVVSQGAFSEAETAYTLKMVLDGLSYLHHSGIVHRDIKPENLLYHNTSPWSRLLITDFGLAHLRQSPYCPTMSTTCGTPEYIAPEVLTRQPYTNKVDLWAVGVIAYILLSGTMPFDDDNRTRLYVSIIRAQYKFPKEHWSTVSSGARYFVRCLLEPDPDTRLNAREALCHSWLVSVLQRSQQSSPCLPAHRNANKARSSRSNVSSCSLTRSERNHRVNPEELDKLQHDPEILKLISKRPGDHILDVL